MGDRDKTQSDGSFWSSSSSQSQRFLTLERKHEASDDMIRATSGNSGEEDLHSHCSESGTWLSGCD